MESEPDSTSENTNVPYSDSSQQEAPESGAAGEGNMTAAAETAAASSDDRTGSMRASRNEEDNAEAGAAAAAEQGGPDADGSPTQLAAADTVASGEVEHVVQASTEDQGPEESHDSATPAAAAAVAEHDGDKPAAPEDSAPVTASATDSTQSNSSAADEAPKTPSEVSQAPKTSSKTATQPTAPLPAPTEPHNAADEDAHKSSKGPGPSSHKETAVERLTTPTAMRMLKQLEQTQGGKQEWHIATGVPFKSKKLSADEMSQMVDRLCTPKHEADNLPPKPHAVKLVFEGNKETLVPVKETSKEDNISYMSNLYARCQETRAKTMQTLQDKWLQPLTKPKQAAK